MASEIVLDASALVEYADATRKGKLVQEIIEHGDSIVVVPSIVLGEFASLLERRGFDSEKALAPLLEFVIPADVKAHHCIKAGRRHSALRKMEKDISLADCIVMEIAHEHDAMILTTDSHFRHYKNARIL